MLHHQQEKETCMTITTDSLTQGKQDHMRFDVEGSGDGLYWDIGRSFFQFWKNHD